VVRGGGGAVDDRLKGFTWRDGERLIRFGRGTAEDPVELLGGAGYVLLTTDRAAAAAPQIAAAAVGVHQVGEGLVEEIAGDLREAVAGDRLVALGGAHNVGDGVVSDRLVALGGGRVIDVAKALAAASGARAMAVPTTLSGAEMTRGHRHARGVDPSTPRVRCAVVVNDPALSASQPVPDLAASALNALGHAAEAPCTPHANPVSTLAAHEAARLLARGLPARGEPRRDSLALGALLAGYALDASAFGLHHVLAQTLVRVAGIPHAHANAVMLPHSLRALAWRFPEPTESLGTALGEDPVEVAEALRALTGVTRLSDAGVTEGDLRMCADTAAARSELDNTPPRASRAELLALYEHAL
jgi:alcohol dehydrogenase class IV